jgi:hypothetical protein
MTQDSTHPVPETNAISRRRLLLAASAILLPTGELFLPFGPEAEAREGSANGALEGRGHRNRRGRDKHKHRDRRKKKDRHKNQDPAPQLPPGGFRNVAMYVHNYRSVDVNLQAWVFDRQTKEGAFYKVPSGWGWTTLPARKADGSHASRAFVGESRQVLVQFGTSRESNVVYGENPDWGFPYASILSDGMTPRGQAFGRKLKSGSLWVWDSIAIEGVKVTRIPDNDDYIQFSVDL